MLVSLHLGILTLSATQFLRLVQMQISLVSIMGFSVFTAHFKQISQLFLSPSCVKVNIDGAKSSQEKSCWNLKISKDQFAIII